MGSLLSDSQSSIHGLIANVSSLFGLIVFLQQIWGNGSLPDTLLTAAVAGLAVYLVLGIGYAAVLGILRHGRSSEDGEEAAEGKAGEGEAGANQETSEAEDENAGEQSPQDTDSVAEVQAA